MTTARVLLVDDVALFLQFERPFFERAGCAILTASSGDEALRSAREHKPHIILLDYEMPGMAGDDVCRALKEDPATRHIPVLIVTSHASAGVAERCRRAGAMDVLTKPIAGKALLERVLGVLQIPHRVHVRTRVALEVSLGREGEAAAVFGYSDNVSEGGMLVETVEPLEQGAEVRIRFSLPGRGEPIEAVAEVVRSSAHPGPAQRFDVALRFTGGGDASKAILREYIRGEVMR
ncbi:MAG TPA: response regulator [Candidatus Polarisedimenticolia bacterium]|nr:response regulator [Candidatus Polarisedimenticolia bacterium]